MVCPECGAEVSDAARIAHAEDHWPEEVLRKAENEGHPMHHAEARRRKDLLVKEGAY